MSCGKVLRRAKIFREVVLFSLVFLIYSTTSPCLGNERENPVVRTTLGRIKGSLMESRLGKTIYSFRGIKYSKPPTGARRFKPAEPVDKWTSVYDASQEGPSCPRPGGKNISEDCLILNIYTTKLPVKKIESFELRPVIVFFHPGGFYGFSSQSYMFGPQYLMDQDIVLITVNYRLSSLGFISTGDKYAPGNLGLKDQVVALRFVRDHVADFGGNPNLVTITGQSAGSRSVYLHMLSPMSRGLFHRVIGLSGSPTVLEAVPHHQKHLAIKQAKILNCTTENMDKMFKCLREKPAEDFGNSVGKFAEWHGDPIAIWYPVVEPNIPGVERFLTDQPVKLIRSGNFYQVPVFTGVTQDEFGGVIVRATEAARNGDNSTFVELNENWETIAPISFLYQRGTERSKHISRELFKFYFHDQPISLNNSIGRAHLYADAITIFPVYRGASLLAVASKEPVYFYKFAYQGRYSFTYWSNKKPYGVVHHDDLIYLFYLSYKFPMFKNDDPEIRTVRRMTAMWANFAKTGHPIPKTDDNLFKGVEWIPLTDKNKAYLEINEDLVMKENLYADRMNFLDKLFPLSSI